MEFGGLLGLEEEELGRRYPSSRKEGEEGEEEERPSLEGSKTDSAQFLD